jgi:DNA-binding MarR family transcriptional regulator
MSAFDHFTMLLDSSARVRGRVRELFSPLHAEIGLNEMEMTVLNAVVAAPSAPTVPRIGRSLGHPRQVIQRAATTLVQRDLIRLLVNPDHKRAPLLAPTATGNALKRKADRLAKSIIAPILRDVDASALRVAARALTDLRYAIESSDRLQQGARRRSG